MDISKNHIIRIFKTYTLPILLIGGLLLITTYYLFKWFDNEYWQLHNAGFKEMFGFGLTIIGSGIFLAVLKWFQFMGFFKEELHSIIDNSEFDEKIEAVIYKVVYGDNFLNKRNDLESLWKRVNRALFKNQFSDELAERIEQKMQDVFFHNSNLSHYYKNFIQTLKIDLDSDDFLTLNITVEAKIIRQSEEKFNYEVYYFIERTDDADTTSTVTFNKLTIDKKEIDLTKAVTTTEKGLTIKKDLNCELEGQKEYLLYSNITIVYKLNKKDEYQFFVERFLDYVRIDVKLSNNLRAVFVPLGNEEFEVMEDTNEGFVRVYPGILLPEKGFRLIFIKK